MNGEDKQRILNSVDKELETAKLNIPAKLFRSLLVKLKIDGRGYDRLIRAYLERTSTSKDPVTLASDRGNLNKALLANKISWKTFMRGIEMLTALNMRVTVDIQLPTKRWVSVDTGILQVREGKNPLLEETPIDHDLLETPPDEGES